MAPSPKLLKLTVVQHATQKNVTDAKNWAAMKKASAHVSIEATTSPRNSSDAWKQIRWSGDRGEPCPGQPNRRKRPLAVSKRYHVEATLGGAQDHVDVCVLWAAIEIIIKGTRPAHAVPFDPNTRDNTDKLGPVT